MGGNAPAHLADVDAAFVVLDAHNLRLEAAEALEVLVFSILLANAAPLGKEGTDSEVRQVMTHEMYHCMRSCQLLMHGGGAITCATSSSSSRPGGRCSAIANFWRRKRLECRSGFKVSTHSTRLSSVPSQKKAL